MTTFRGAVTAESATHARLMLTVTLHTGISSRRVTWRGHIDDIGDTGARAGDRLHLHLPNGRSGVVLVKDAAGAIEGDGPPPFGDQWDDLAARISRRLNGGVG